MIIYVVYLGNERQILYEPAAVFDYLIQSDITAEEALNAEGWCELATIGEYYDGDDFGIQIDTEESTELW